MTPKEKAQDMYINYLSTIKFTMEDCSFTYRDEIYELYVRKTAIWLCLKSVDEIINTIQQNLIEFKGCYDFQLKVWWQEVKQEIEKL